MAQPNVADTAKTVPVGSATPVPAPKIESPQTTAKPATPANQPKTIGIKLPNVGKTIQAASSQQSSQHSVRVAVTLTEENLKEYWDQAINEINEEKLTNMLAGLEPELISQNLIQVTTTNVYLENDFTPFRTKFYTRLRELTGHAQIQLQFKRIVVQVERKKYMPREKFDFMREVNPALGRFLQQFDQIDY